MDQIKTINYLGSKFRILKDIEMVIDQIDPEYGMVCDLFAGSGTVSEYLSHKRKVFSTDIQEYSRAICSALLNDIKFNLDADKIILNIKEGNLFLELESIFSKLITYEDECISRALDGELEPLANYLERVSLYTVKYDMTEYDKNSQIYILQKEIIDRLNKKNLMDSCIIAQDYGGIYFSIRQSVQIDSAVNYINDNYDGVVKDKLIASVISAASEIVNTVGKQFAQPINPRNGKGEIKKNIGIRINKDRGKDFWESFKKWINIYLLCGKSGNIVQCMDCSKAIDELPDEVTVVYADPPYTRYHYSRYYHVLETIALYDKPAISMVTVDGKVKLSRGMYRENRYQSSFCIKSQALSAMRELIKKVSFKGKKLVISYSPYDRGSGSTPRLMEVNDIIEMAEQYYSGVFVKELDNIVHSKLNRRDKNYKVECIAEVLIICENNGGA